MQARRRSQGSRDRQSHQPLEGSKGAGSNSRALVFPALSRARVARLSPDVVADQRADQRIGVLLQIQHAWRLASGTTIGSHVYDGRGDQRHDQGRHQRRARRHARLAQHLRQHEADDPHQHREHDGVDEELHAARGPGCSGR